MANPKHRSIRERWVVTGKLQLETPAHFGNGEADALTDMPLFFDEGSRAPLLTGASIAGALRNYLREVQNDYGGDFPDKEDEAGVEHERGLLATKLFGGYRGDDEGDQSPLIVYDAIGKPAGIELRDGVKIDEKTRTAEDQKKFDIQLLAAGTTFDLRFELLISGNDNINNGNDDAGNWKDKADELKKALATALMGLTNRQITLGARKRRGFGQCTVDKWNVRVYDLRNPNGLKGWLASERAWANEFPLPPQPQIDLSTLADTNDKRQTAHLSAEFNIDGTLLIRSGFGDSDQGPDSVHLHSPRPKKDNLNEQERKPVIPGTSWAGVLRHRALKIARTILMSEKRDNGKDDLKAAQTFVDGMFGPSEIKKGNTETKASRIVIKESAIEHPAAPRVVTRVKIDRFTGGAYEGALFNEQPVIGKPETGIKLDLSLRKNAMPRMSLDEEREKTEKAENKFQAEIGLLLLLLKDLWTGDLPIGGEAGVGRGRLHGKYAKLSYGKSEWEIIENKDGSLQLPSDTKGLEDFVEAVNNIENWTV